MSGDTTRCQGCKKEIPPGRKIYVCPDCHEEAFCSKKCVRKHQTLKHTEKYTCSQCNRPLFNKLTGDVKFQRCPDCDDDRKYCTRPSCLTAHRKTHHFGAYFCQVCGKSLHSMISKKIQYLHCEFCGDAAGKFCSDPSCLERHFRQKHPGQRICAECGSFIVGKSLFCNDCGKNQGSYCSPKCFDAHLRHSHTEDHVCAECGGFIKKEYFSCGICGESAGKYCSERCLIPHKRHEHHQQFFCAYCDRYIRGKTYFNQFEEKLRDKIFCSKEHLNLYFEAN